VREVKREVGGVVGVLEEVMVLVGEVEGMLMEEEEVEEEGGGGGTRW